MIPYGRQLIDEDDIAAVVDVLRSDFVTLGPAIGQFERAVAEHCEARFVCAVSSATAALHVACMSLGLGAGKWLWTTPNTFVASANCGRYCGAQIDFVDIDPQTYCMSPDALAEKLAAAERAHCLPSVVVAVDFAGQPCDWDRIAELKARYGFRVVEDASHAVGAEYKGHKVGSLGVADCTVFSFHPVKIVTTGEGGAIVTHDESLHAQHVMLRSHGITRDPLLLHKTGEGAWYYEQLRLGYNYRMTDMQAALGASQIKKLERFVARRRELAKRYDILLSGMEAVQTPWQHPDGHSAFHLYPILLPDARVRRKVFDALRAGNIGVQVHYIPVHTQPDFMTLGFKEGDFPAAEAYYARTLSLPLHAGLTDTQQDDIVAALKCALMEAES